MMTNSLLHRRWAALLTIVLISLSGCAQMAAVMGIEEPAYQVLKQDSDFELRQYRSFIVAETFISGSFEEASNQGFRLIADYIFGNNISAAQSGAEKIAMTAPVTTEKIAMTAPVTTEQVGAQWRVHFVMPAKYTLATLPKPVNPKVRLREVPGNQIATIQFSGFSSEEKMKAKTEALLAWMKQQGLEAAAAPQLARYNPPITPPFLRRNEMMIAVK